MRAAVHEDGPVQRPHELDVIRFHIARQRILFLQNSRPTKTAPLVRKRVGSALKLRRAPNRFRGGVRPQAPRVVERNPEIVPQWRLRRRVLFIVFQAPFAGDIHGDCRSGRPLGQHWNAHQHACDAQEEETGGLAVGSIHIPSHFRMNLRQMISGDALHIERVLGEPDRRRKTASPAFRGCCHSPGGLGGPCVFHSCFNRPKTRVS